MAPAALLPQVQLLFYYCFEVGSVAPQSFTKPVGIAVHINQIRSGWNCVYIKKVSEEIFGMTVAVNVALFAIFEGEEKYSKICDHQQSNDEADT